MKRSRTARTAYAGVLTTCLATVCIALAPWHGLNLVGTLLLACVPCGAGLVCWLDSGEDSAQAGLTVVVSLSVFAIFSTIMIWLAAWHPVALLGVAWIGLASCLLRLAREDR